ncbi:MAG: PAS domain S-box protein [Desulfobulbaceae bacterium]|nr:PAS domain S-box protein [Desulfobulbaceae bacterium]
MNTSSDNKTPLTTNWAVLILAVLVAVGLAANYFKYELFFNIQFIFGSIFAILALQLLGITAGILAALLISSITYPLWNHPYAIITMTAEVVIVGLLHRRKGVSVILADALYWLGLGMPMVYLFYHEAMKLTLSNTLVTMVKQALNGITNAVIAGAIFMFVASSSGWRRFSFREVILYLLAFFVLWPSLAIMTLDSRTEFTDTDQAIRTSLIQSSFHITRNLDQWLRGHMSLISHLAKIAAISPVSFAQQEVEEVHKGNPDFQRVGLVDKGATIIAFSPLTDEVGQPTLGRNFADRPFIPTLKQTLQPMLSEMFIARINTREPIVSLLAPVVQDGRYSGYTIGILSLHGLKKIIEGETQDLSLIYTLLDRNGKVIVSNNPTLQPMDPFVRDSSFLQRLNNGVSQWIPKAGKNISISASWTNSFYIKESTFGRMAEWTLILEQPVEPFRDKLLQRFAKKLGLLLIVLLLALALSDLISRKTIHSLDKLSELSNKLPQKMVDHDMGEIVWPQSRFFEIENLTTNFKTMVKIIQESFHKIHALNINLESTIQKRTQEARQIATRYKTLMSTATDGIHIFDLQGNMIEANDSFCKMLGYSHEEILQLNIHDWEVKHTREEIDRNFQNIVHGAAHFTTQHRRKNGEIRDVEISASAAIFDGKTLIFNTSRDITERKILEKEREQFQIFFNNSIDMMCIANPNGTFLKVNPTCEKLLGYSEEELLSRPFVDFIHPDDKQPTLDEMARLIKCGSSLNIENRFQRKDGTYLWLSWQAKYNREENLTFANARDITERKKTEKTLRQAVREKEVMLKEIHHRVKNNMQVVYSLLSLQARNIDDSIIRTMFEESKNRISSMSLIHEKLYLSPDLSLIDFKEYIDRLVAEIASTYNRPDIVFTVDMPPLQFDINISIPCGLIINELVSNCLKHAFPNGKKGTITIRMSENSEGELSLSVSDDGIGFPAEIDYANTTSLGMQLIVVLAGQLNGTVKLDSEEGTTFTITFPTGQINPHHSGILAL